MATLKLKREKLLIYELGKFWWKKLWATYSKLTKHNRHIIFNGVEIFGNTLVLLKKTKSPFTFCWFVKCDEKILILVIFYSFVILFYFFLLLPIDNRSKIGLMRRGKIAKNNNNNIVCVLRIEIFDWILVELNSLASGLKDIYIRFSTNSICES